MYVYMCLLYNINMYICMCIYACMLVCVYMHVCMCVYVPTVCNTHINILYFITCQGTRVIGCLFLTTCSGDPFY